VPRPGSSLPGQAWASGAWRGAVLEVLKQRKICRVVYRRTDIPQVSQRYDTEWTLGFFRPNLVFDYPVIDFDTFGVAWQYRWCD